ncbi:MAG: triacylglycerol lipase [Lachnospiraceae bacterium]|nr:triacylglycerol lipase [Ruminococcus sp.]MCM1276075.1 triacylglycerol lipase [Lachnospiraceae bacterium]
MKIFIRVLNWIILVFGMNMPIILANAPLALKIALGAALLIYFVIFNIFPSLRKYPTLRLKILGDGAELILAFWVTCAAASPYVGACIAELVGGGEDYPKYIVYAVVLILCEAAIFWNGIIRVYVTSVQLGIRTRVLGVVFGMVPIANLVMLMIIYVRVKRETLFETEKHRLNESRKNDKICATKYPVLLVHGVFFRDSRLLNYWGRIPAELEKNGAEIYYGEQQSALSIEQSSEELAKKIEDIALRTGCGKVNIIAHSKGGLDSRYAISKLGCDKYVATLTTINTPHRGCLFAEYLLGAAPERIKNFIEKTYNKAFYALGDNNPDFMSAVKCLTNSYCEQFNRDVPDSPDVMYQSYGSKAVNRRGARFPLNFSYPVVKKFDGDNDGLVALDSAPWGEKFTPIYPPARRGITHADMIDLNREDIRGFDVREFYVQLVADLKNRGF